MAIKSVHTSDIFCVPALINGSYTGNESKSFAMATPVKFLSKDFQGALEADPALKDEIYKAVCDAYIFRYQTGAIGIDDITIAEDFINEES